jgi:hypothetical protein
MVAMGPATEIVEATDAFFTPILKEAISRYPKFALYTQAKRENPVDECWARLS